MLMKYKSFWNDPHKSHSTRVTEGVTHQDNMPFSLHMKNITELVVNASCKETEVKFFFCILGFLIYTSPGGFTWVCLSLIVSWETGIKIKLELAWEYEKIMFLTVSAK